MLQKRDEKGEKIQFLLIKCNSIGEVVQNCTQLLHKRDPSSISFG